jgi:hydrogenase large subunit
MARIVIDPVTRIEGYLRIEAQVQDARVTDAWSSSAAFRGIESIFCGRDPRDTWTVAQRLCGGCATVHALCAVRAVENALNIQIPENARLIRNVVAGIQHIQDHVLHFYHLHAWDWVDMARALTADPAKAAHVAQSISDWPLSSADYFGAVKDRVAFLIQDGRQGILDNRYQDHPANELPSETSLMVVAHYLQALDWQRDMIRIQAICGAKSPHLQTFRVGGMACPMESNNPTNLNSERLALVKHLFVNARGFVERVYLHDLTALASFYKEWADYGGGLDNYLACGDFPTTASDGRDPGSLFLPRGIILSGDLNKVYPLDQDKITGLVTRSWIEQKSGDLSPGDQAPIERPQRAPEYSWINSPRYKGTPMEVGPLARMLIAYALGHEQAKFWVDAALAKLEVGVEALCSTLGRILTRGIETVVLADKVSAWVDELASNMGRGDLRTRDTERWNPETWPKEALGCGWVETPCGALGHWVHIKDGGVANYQCLVPSAWNASPRDAEGRRGALEAALLGIPVVELERPIEILRTVHSFDPCMVCAVHVSDPDQREATCVRAV